MTQPLDSIVDERYKLVEAVDSARTAVADREKDLGAFDMKHFGSADGRCINMQSTIELVISLIKIGEKR